MDQDSISKKAPPVQQTSPEEDATLLAIEALEAQSIDLDTPPTVVAPAPVTPEAPVVPAPEPETVAVPAPAPQPPVAAQPEQPIPTPPQPQPEPAALVIPEQQPETTPATPAQRIAAVLASDEPAPKRFQFFAHQKPPRKPFVIGGILVILIALGVSAYITLL